MIILKFRKNSALVAIILCLILTFAFPVSASAVGDDALMPCASYYLDAYSAYVYVTDSGEVQVWFDVMGTGWMDEIGALSIRLYESTDGTNWTWVETFLHEDCDTMLFYDECYISSHVSYPNGSTTKQYKAYVGIWAGKNGDGDTRYFWAYQP